MLTLRLARPFDVLGLYGTVARAVQPHRGFEHGADTYTFAHAMLVSSACPLRVASVVWQPRPSSFALTVVCKATFALAPGTSPLAAIQDEPNAADAWWSDDPRLSLRWATDLAPFKRRADILAVGHAFAPGEGPVTQLAARLIAGDIDKEIAVYGDRSFGLDGRPTEPAPFTTMPLRWERSAGGLDTSNPAGLVLTAPPDRLGRIPLPNLLPAGAHIESRSDVVRPAGFGPLAPTWPERRANLHADATSWDYGRWNERPLPDGIDAGFFNVAPPDQQPGELPPSPRIVLGNLHREHPQLVTRLAPILPRAICTPNGGPSRDVRLRCDTLCIDTDRAVVTLVWRGVVQLEHPAQEGRIVVGVDAAPVVATETAKSSAKPNATVPLDLATLQGPRSLPFGHGAGPSAASIPSAPLPRVVKAPAGLVATGNIDPSLVRAALPFAGNARPQPAPATPISEVPAPIAPTPIASLAMHPPAAPSGLASESAWARGAPLTPVPALPIPPSSPLAAPLAPIAPVAPPIALVARAEATPLPVRAVAVDPVQLLWFAREIVSPLRKDRRWSAVLGELDDRPLDDDLDDPDLVADVADVDERREVFEILTRGSAIGEDGVLAALASGVRTDGRFVQPIVLLSGELALPFDEVQALKAILSAAMPYAGTDVEARAVLEQAKDLLGAPGQPAAPAVAEGLTTRIRTTFEKRDLVPAGLLDAHAARALLRGRHHQRRRVLGGVHLRGVWNTGAGSGIPAYVDGRDAAKLPATERVRARALAFVHPTLEHNETHPVALRIVALAIVSAPLARR